MVEVTADVEDISNKDDSFFQQFDLVVATNCAADQLVTNQYNFVIVCQKYPGFPVQQILFSAFLNRKLFNIYVTTMKMAIMKAIRRACLPKRPYHRL